MPEDKNPGVHRRGVLLVNLGSPATPSVRDVRCYLNEFLMDGRVLDVPWFLRKLIVTFGVLPFRSRRSAAAYRSIWWEEGSPLIVISRRVQQRVQKRLDVPVALGMSYGEPGIDNAIRQLMEGAGGRVDRLLLVPMYPHYAMSTYESVVVAVRKALAGISPDTLLDVHPPFFNDPLYIDALVGSAREYLEWDYDHLLFSYHGLPERHLRKTDPTGRHCLADETCCTTASPAHDTCYRAQVLKTTAAFVRTAGIPANRFSVAFQSRLGRDSWLSPATGLILAKLPSSGIKKLLVICPSFVSDCLETLEEIGIRGRRLFLQSGGTEMRLIPCLNDHPLWIKALASWCS